MNKFKVTLLSLVALCFCAGMLVFGVFSSLYETTYSTTGQFEYNQSGTDSGVVDVTTSLYVANTNDTFDENELYQNVRTLDSVYRLGKEDSQIDGLTKDNKYLSQNLTIDTSKENIITVDMPVAYGDYIEGQSGHAYYLVMDLKNKTDEPVNVSMNIDSSVATNSIFSVNENNVSINASKGDSNYIVVAMTGKDATQTTSDSLSLEFTVEKTEEVPEDTPSTAERSTDFEFQVNAADKTAVLTKYVGVSQDVVIPNNINPVKAKEKADIYADIYSVDFNNVNEIMNEQSMLYFYQDFVLIHNNKVEYIENPYLWLMLMLNYYQDTLDSYFPMTIIPIERFNIDEKDFQYCEDVAVQVTGDASKKYNIISMIFSMPMAKLMSTDSNGKVEFTYNNENITLNQESYKLAESGDTSNQSIAIGVFYGVLQIMSSSSSTQEELEGALQTLTSMCPFKFTFTKFVDLVFDSDPIYNDVELEGEYKVVEISDDAFTGNALIKNVYIPDSVEIINNNAFNSCVNLQNVDFAENSMLTTIGSSAFYGCSNLSSITLPENVTTINSDAFYNCSNLAIVLNRSSLNISKGFTSNGYVGYYASIVYNCKKGSNVSVETINNVMYINDLDNGEMIACTIVDEAKTDIVLDSRTTQIADEAFRDEAITSIDLPQNLKTIGSYAFDGCSNLSSIILPENVTTINSDAFQNCTSLSEVQLPDSLKTIGSSAFSGCSSLQSIEIPEGITNISDYTFCDCTSLKKVEISPISKLTKIGTSAFTNSAIEYIVIPKDVNEIDTPPNSRYHPFYGCFSLKIVLNYSSLSINKGSSSNGSVGVYASIVYNCEEGSNVSVETIDNVMYVNDLDNGEMIAFAIVDNTKTDIVLDSRTTQIADKAFRDEAITSIDLPQNLKTIGSYAFDGCSNLSSIILPENVTTINSNAFYNCTSLSEVQLPDSLKTIGRSAFYNCSSLQSIEIPEGITNISDFTFCDCTSLSEVQLPDSLKTIGSYAFDGCSNLSSIILPENVTTINSNAFYNCYKLLEVYNNSSLILNIGQTNYGYVVYYAKQIYTKEDLTTMPYPTNIQQIGDIIYYIDETNGDFIAVKLANQSVNLDVTLDERTTEIFSYAFYNSGNLRSIILPQNLKTIGSSAFYGCSSLQSIEIPEGITSISDYTFYNCTSLSKVQLPDSLETIGRSAFYGCSNLSSITLPENVTTINSNAFYHCSNLAVVLNYSNLNIYKNNSSNGYVGYYASIVYNCEEGSNAFIEIIDNVMYINDLDNGEMIACTIVDEAKTDIVLDSRTTQIADEAFRNEAITSIDLPENLKSIGSLAFYGCSNLKYVFNHSDLILVARSEDYGYVAYYAQIVWNKDDLTNGQPVVETYVKNNVRYLSDIVNNKLVAMEILDKKVYYIELDNNTSNLFDRIFAGCVNLQSIDLKNTKIKTIGSYAFANCINLKSVTFPDTLMSIGDNAFSYCRSLTEISLPKALWAIGDEAFQSCYELKTIVFDGDSELVSIGNYAFSDCISLKSFDMPDSVTSIGSNVFENCLSLENVKISQNLVSIPSYSFRYCENLKLVTIPENSKIKEIGQSAFYNCKNLQKISISPDSELEQIGAEAFANCSSLESILLPSKLNYIYTRSNSDNFKSSFENCTNLAYVYNYSTLYLSIGNSGNGAVALNAYVVYNKEQYDLTIDDIIFETIGNVKYYIEPITNNYVAYGIVDKSQEVVLDVKTNRIGPKIFYNNSNLTSINLQDLTNLIEICTQAFYNCYNLISVSFPNSLKYIGPSAFQGCTTLSSITIPDSLVEIGSDAFYGCSALSSVLINDSSNLQIIGSYAFQNCSKLVNVILPEGLLKIGDYAFSNCSALSSIDIPDSLIEIGKNAFDDCSALSSVSINDSSNLQIIGSYAFYNCAELETITITEKVIKIGSYAFYNSGLKTAVFKSPSGWGYISGEEREGISESSLSNSSTAASYLCSRSYNYYYWTWEKIS